MADASDESDFDAGRAELFDAISHPVRIRILESLETRSMGFSELKKAVGIQSGGRLAFHLTKLRYLVTTNASGDYELTDDGRDALWSAKSLRAVRNGIHVARTLPSVGNRWKATVAVLLVALVVVSGFGIVFYTSFASISSYEGSISTLNAKLSSAQGGLSTMSSELSSRSSQSASQANRFLSFIAYQYQLRGPLPSTCIAGPLPVVVGYNMSNFEVPFMASDPVTGTTWLSINSQQTLPNGTHRFVGMVEELNWQGRLPAVLTLTGSANNLGRFNIPFGIAFDSNGNLWVDNFGGEIYEFRPPFSSQMNASVVIGVDSYFLTGLSFDKAGDLWVTDAANNRVLEFVPPFASGMSPSLALGQSSLSQSIYGNLPTTQHGLVGPWSVASDASGRIWVSDKGDNRILGFTPPFHTGMNASIVLGQPDFSTNGNGNTPATMRIPTNIVSDFKGDIWVNDFGNGRILVFSPPFTSGMSGTIIQYGPWGSTLAGLAVDSQWTASGVEGFDIWTSYDSPFIGTGIVEYPISCSE